MFSSLFKKMPGPQTAEYKSQPLKEASPKKSSLFALLLKSLFLSNDEFIVKTKEECKNEYESLLSSLSASEASNNKNGIQLPTLEIKDRKNCDEILRKLQNSYGKLIKKIK
jgi:hypothetical protein